MRPHKSIDPTLPHCVWSLPPRGPDRLKPSFALGCPAAKRPPSNPLHISNSAAHSFMAQLKHAGFTLLELLVVISIMALATAGVSLAIRDSGEQQLEREAQRLATLLESARAQARTNGTLVIWRPMPQGFRFEGLPKNVNMPTQWLQAAVQVQPKTPVVLGPEPLIPKQSLTLSLPGSNSAALQLSTDGLRPFHIQSLQVAR